MNEWLELLYLNQTNLERKGGIAKVNNVGGINVLDFCHIAIRHSTIINLSAKTIDVSLDCRYGRRIRRGAKVDYVGGIDHVRLLPTPYTT